MVKSGNKHRVYLTTGSGTGTDTWIAGEQSHNVDYNNNTIDASDKSTEWDQFISGNKNWTASATFNADSSSNEQKTLLQSLVNGQKVKVFIGELGSGSGRSDGMAGEALEQSVSQTAERNGILSRQVSLQGTGAPTLIFPAS